MTTYLNGTAIPASTAPEVRITNACTLNVELCFGGTPTAAQIAACGVGQTVVIGMTISNGVLNCAGTVATFNVRVSYTVMSLKNATATFV